MRLIVAITVALAYASLSWAEITPHEAAAKRVYKISSAVDKPRLLQAFSTGMGVRVSPTDMEAVAEAWESSELESIYIRHLMKIFSESELVALAEMMNSPAYRVYVDRMPAFLQSVMPEFMAYGQKALPEFQRRAAEKRKLSSGGWQSPKPTTEPNPILEERLRNAQVSEKRLSNGAVITEVKFAGSLQPNLDVGCISMGEVTGNLNPPALIYAAKKCIQQDEYAKAWALLTTGNGFAYYDLKRLADRSTQGARQVLTMNVFADLTTAQRDKAARISKEIQADPEQVKAYCAELTRIGPPTYEPQWAILHGIGAYQEPRDGHYLTNVDAKALWEEVLRNRCTPQKS